MLADDPASEIWVSYVSLALQHFKFLALAPDGETPLSPGGRALVRGGILPKFYADSFGAIGRIMKQDDFATEFFAYDWRKGFIQNGQLLAQFLQAGHAKYSDITLVAHSFGGLVCRAAWRHMSDTPLQSKIRRIITLGTSHQGSYATVLLASGDHETASELAFISNLFSGLSRYAKTGGTPSPPNILKNFSKQEIANVILTFPGYYDLLPAMGGTDAEGDPHRAMLYESGNWPLEIDISQAWLANEVDVVDPWLADPRSMPPAHVLTTVAGVGEVTPWGLVKPDLLGTTEAIGTVSEGDGTVARSSALVPQSAQHTVVAHHMDIPGAVASSGDIRPLILDERSPEQPPPPVTHNPTIVLPSLHFPPFENGAPYLTSMGGCALGDCKCPEPVRL